MRRAATEIGDHQAAGIALGAWAKASAGDVPFAAEDIVAIERLDVSFVPDVQESSYGTGYAFVQALGIRSSLRTPVTIAGQEMFLKALRSGR